MAIQGLTNTLAKEGAARNIKVNSVAPIAMTRMTESNFPKEIMSAFSVENVSPIVMFLAHESCPLTGAIVETGGG